MQFSQKIFTWLVSVVVFVGLDMVWLSVIMKDAYQKALGKIANPQTGEIIFKLVPGLITQILIATGLSVLVLKLSSLQAFQMPLMQSMLWGAFFGFIIYFTYDFTNYSFVLGWSLKISIIDVLWGTFQGAVAGVVVSLMIQFFTK